MPGISYQETLPEIKSFAPQSRAGIDAANPLKISGTPHFPSFDFIIVSFSETVNDFFRFFEKSPCTNVSL